MKRYLPAPAPCELDPKLLLELKVSIYERAFDMKLIGLAEVPGRFCKEGNQRSTSHPLTLGLRLGMKKIYHPEYIMGHCYGDRKKDNSRPSLDQEDKNKLMQLKCKEQTLLNANLYSIFVYTTI
jgi:hypothetical protein